jgi:hypothetical protein
LSCQEASIPIFINNRTCRGCPTSYAIPRRTIRPGPVAEGAGTLRRETPMNRPRNAIFITLACLAVAAPQARAWNKPGHMVTGAIAYMALKQDSPAALAKAVALLKEHPYYEERWKALTEKPFVPAGERDLYLFMLAAKWADDARSDSDYYPEGAHRDRWHYVNIPFRPEGTPDTVKAKPYDPEFNLFFAYSRNIGRVTSASLDPEQRAVSLAWVLHLVGDAHQPLHSSALFSEAFPDGDRGGTLFWVRATEDGSTIHLHHFWDGLILGSERFQGVRNKATDLWTRVKKSELEELKEPSFEIWVRKESFGLAKKEAYLNGKLEGSATRSAAKALPDGYVKQAKAVAERRAVLAGYRLAALLKKAFE